MPTPTSRQCGSLRGVKGRPKTWLLRSVALLALLGFGWVLDHYLAPLGLRWIVWVLGGIVAAFFVVEIALRTHKKTKEAAEWRRWRAAMDDPKARRDAIRQLRSRIDQARRFGLRMRVRHARLATTLAELHLADEDADTAVRVLAKVPVSDLEPLQAAVVRLARAQAHLHRGSADEAAITLAQIPDPSGDAVVDAAATLARGSVALEEGRVDEAKAAAERIEALAEPHDELWNEARALKAACLEARGDSAAARDALADVDEAGRRRLSQLGTSRVRALVS